VGAWQGELAPAVNAVAAAVGAGLGAVGLRGLTDTHRTTVLQGVSLAVLALGASMTLSGTANPLLWVASMVLGGVTGQLLRLEERLDAASARLQRRFAQGSGAEDRDRFAQGFVLATLVFCVGPLAILGALRSGLDGDGSLLYAKSLLDGVTGLFLASAMGWGVVLAAVPVLLYEGGIAVAAHLVAPLLPARGVAALTQVGGLLVTGIGLNLLLGTRIRVANLLPAVVWAPALVAFLPHLF
jgi:uncharacterized membrane protein YqgA involved in biofilm formation